MTRTDWSGCARWVVAASVLTIAACENLPEQFKPRAQGEGTTLTGGTSLSFEERDIEAPEVFDVTDTAIWDGRPSFGGVWVAYPGSTQPERVTITNKENGKSVIGALFKSEKDNPGPKIKLSSDAAEAIGVVAGQPTTVSIVAIRRQPVQLEPEVPPVVETVEIATPEPSAVEDAPVETTVLTETIATAIDTAPKPNAVVETAPKRRPKADEPAVAAIPSAPASNVPTKPFIQVATLTSESNASKLEKRLSDNGISSLIRVSKTSTGKDLYRVLAGPAMTKDAVKTLAGQVSALGFTDAFPVTN